MNKRSFIIWLVAGIGLFLIGNGLSGFVVYEQTCCFPSPFCEEVLECDFTRPIGDNSIEVGKNMEFIIGGTMFLFLLFVLHGTTNFFRE